MDGDLTYFAITGPSTGNLGSRRLLERLRDRFKASRNGFEDQLVPVIGRLISSLESMSRHQATDSATTDGLPTSSRALLLGKASGKLDRKKSKDRILEAEDGSEDGSDRGINIELPPEPASGVVSLRKSSSSRNRGPQHARKSWCRHVKIVIAIDVILCVVLFGVWLGICGGFQCL